MGCRWLILLCLASTWLVTEGLIFWPYLFQKQVGYYHDPCGPTLYRMREQGVPNLPHSMYIPLPMYQDRRHPPSRPSSPVNHSGVAPPSTKQAPPPPPARSARPPSGPPQQTRAVPPPPKQSNPPPPRSGRPPTRQQPVGPDPWYPYSRAYRRPLDPLLLHALDIDIGELPDSTTQAPAPRSGTRQRGSAAPRAKRQVAGPRQAPASRKAAPHRGQTHGVNQEHCYCESAYDCYGEHASRGGRYNPQCDASLDLVCCCR